jgi:nucleotide-binding universal stress UspA family protein
VRVLLPLDGAINPQVCDFFSQMANASEATVAVIHVLPPAMAKDDESALAAKAVLADAARQIRSHGPTVVECLCQGDAAREIVEMGRQLDVDLIAMFTRPGSRYAHDRHGSVMESVLNSADRPVIAINDYVGWNAGGVFGRVAFSITPNHALATSGAR